jgi:O-methyltransferase
MKSPRNWLIRIASRILLGSKGNKETISVHAMEFPTISQRQFAEVKKSFDYVRHAAIGLATRRIDLDEVPGKLAEVGVYRGDTARYIHMLSPDRTLFLFDTFEGFPGHKEKEGGSDNRFRDTSTDAVIKALGLIDNVVIKKGYFPETTIGMDNEKFAFVSLDLDKYESTLEGWRYFYPKTSSGGFIFVHDFNNSESNHGCYRATIEFLLDKPEKIIELPDQWGSALIRKV